MDLPEGLEAIRFEDWERSVSPVRGLVRWADRMDPFQQRVETAPVEFERVALEDGCWRIVSIWSDSGRREHHEQVEALRRMLGRS